jgi:hypothetical protein
LLGPSSQTLIKFFQISVTVLCEGRDAHSCREDLRRYRVLIGKVKLWRLKLLWARRYMMLMMLGCYGDRLLISLFKEWSFLDLFMLLHSLDAALLRFLPLQGLVLWHPIGCRSCAASDDGL